MRFLIVTPAPAGSTKGNRITAERWLKILRSLGHTGSLAQTFERQNPDALIAIHAKHSAPAVNRFRAKFSDRPIIVALSGTDLNHDLNQTSIVSSTLDVADQIILLEPEARKKLKQSWRNKSTVIFQSSVPLINRPTKLKRAFEVSVLGHLRAVKDPFRTAMAVRKLPVSSRVHVVHFGEALTESMRYRAIKETDENPRYTWIGPVSHVHARRRLARSHLTVLTSKSEGGPAVVGEAIVNQVPILITRIPAAVGMLGGDYPGFFECGDTRALTDLIRRAETDPLFYQRLVAAGQAKAVQFSRATETQRWREVVLRTNR